MALNRRTLVWLCCGTAVLSACTTVRRVEPVAYFTEHAPTVVWVTYTDNSVVPVAEPVVKRDTLRGLGQDGRERVVIPLSDIKSVQAKVPARTKTALLLAALGVAAVSTLYVGLISKTGPGGNGTTCGLDREGDPLQDC